MNYAKSEVASRAGRWRPRKSNTFSISRERSQMDRVQHAVYRCWTASVAKF